MLSFDDRPYSSFDAQPELSSTSTKEHLTAPLPSVSGSLGREVTEPHRSTQQLLPVTTRQLPLLNDSQITTALSGTFTSNQDTTGVRKALVIKAEVKREKITPLSSRQHNKRRLIVSLIGVIILLLVTSGTLLAASPMGHEMGFKFLSQQGGGNLVAGSSTDPRLVAQATATAVYHRQIDGFDPNASSGQTVGNGSGSLNWPYGQCTYWANSYYHTLTGFWVSWTGNADQWVAGASSAGWNVSQVPHVYSIIVLMPYVQGASGYGHVAVVTGISGNVVHTSNMNWWANGGGWGRVSEVDFTVGSGVWFVWHK